MAKIYRDIAQYKGFLSNFKLRGDEHSDLCRSVLCALRNPPKDPELVIPFSYKDFFSTGIIERLVNFAIYALG